MSDVPLKTCSAFNKFWNNKFYYNVASCWLFLLIHTTVHGYVNIKFVQNCFISSTDRQTDISERLPHGCSWMTLKKKFAPIRKIWITLAYLFAMYL
jgi:hypothetical protein